MFQKIHLLNLYRKTKKFKSGIKSLHFQTSEDNEIYVRINCLWRKNLSESFQYFATRYFKKNHNKFYFRLKSSKYNLMLPLIELKTFNSVKAKGNQFFLSFYRPIFKNQILLPVLFYQIST